MNSFGFGFTARQIKRICVSKANLIRHTNADLKFKCFRPVWALQSTEINR